MIQTGILGTRAEKLALKFLKKKGLKAYQQNFSCRFGEIDLIMHDRDYLVFVEVRYRSSGAFGGALESINAAKQGKLRRSAEYYLIKSNNTDCPCRFDILCINGSLKQPEFHWIQNAF